MSLSKDKLSKYCMTNFTLNKGMPKLFSTKQKPIYNSQQDEERISKPSIDMEALSWDS